MSVTALHLSVSFLFINALSILGYTVLNRSVITQY